MNCVSERQAREVLAAIGARMEQVGLRLHPDKTRIVYCQDGQRPANAQWFFDNFKSGDPVVVKNTGGGLYNQNDGDDDWQR